MDWEAIFQGRRRRVSTVIIGCENDFWSRKPISKEERVRLMRRLKEYVNLSYDSEAAIAAQIGADEGALNGWLTGNVEPTFQSLLKIADFLERQVKRRGGTAPIGYAPIRGNNPNGRKGKRIGVKGEK
jgi:transcriptional regulator with XRE-family HTH domain